MLAEIRGRVADRGYVFIREHVADLDTPTLARTLGPPITPWAGRLVQQLIPRVSSTPNTYSGIYGLDRFPFHTDLAHWRCPPRYLLLRCIKGYSDVPTFLIDGESVIQAVTLDIMTRAIVKPRRPRNGTIHLMRLCEQVEVGRRVRWDEKFLRPASRIGETASQQVRTILSTAEVFSCALARAGDTLLIDNWRMLHARSSIPLGREDRIIERVYLEGLY